MTLDDWPDVASHAMAETSAPFPMALYFVIFIVITNMTLLNLVTGVILENVTAHVKFIYRVFIEQ